MENEPVNWDSRFPDFRIEEILSPDQLVLFHTKHVFPYSLKALDKLQAFRKFVGSSLVVNKTGSFRRGARSMREVYEINRQTRSRERGWEYSFHLWCAFDVSSGSIPSSQLFEMAVDFKDEKLGRWGGIGLYDTFVHVDDRDTLSGGATVWSVRK